MGRLPVFSDSPRAGVFTDDVLCFDGTSCLVPLGCPVSCPDKLYRTLEHYWQVYWASYWKSTSTRLLLLAISASNTICMHCIHIVLQAEIASKTFTGTFPVTGPVNLPVMLQCGQSLLPETRKTKKTQRRPSHALSGDGVSRATYTSPSDMGSQISSGGARTAPPHD